MAHEFESGFYAKEPAWHGPGTVVTGLLTAKEAIVAAGLDWDVKLVPIYAHDTKGRMTKVDEKRAVQRDSDGKVFAVLSPDYTPVQNRDAFTFCDSVIADGSMLYNAAGSLRGGARVWILAEAKDSLSVKGDEIKKYLLLCNGHDGTMAIRMLFTPVRVVCMNTLQAALDKADKTATFYARHTTGVMNRVDTAREILGLTDRFYKGFKEQADILASKKFPTKMYPALMAATFGLKMLPVPVEIKALPAPSGLFSAYDWSTRMVKQLDTVKVLCEHGLGNDTPKVRGTCWAAFNGVTEYIDHAKKYTGDPAVAASNRLENVWGGRGMMAKVNAMNFLLKV